MTPTPPPSSPKEHHILFLDAHDSFSNNITARLTAILPNTTVSVLPIDSPLLPSPSSPDFRRALRKELARYTAVVCGPGPGNPHCGKDVGLMRGVWGVGGDDDEIGGSDDIADGEGNGFVPVLGICLGFQSLVASVPGGSVRRLRRGLHGMVREVRHSRQGIFEGVGRFRATLYHSLCADVGQDSWSTDEYDERRWVPSPQCPDIVPLAWVDEPRDDIEGGGNERILMAAKHNSRPFWGLQYHPESVCSEEAGHKVIVNWFEEALRWNEKTGRKVELDEGQEGRELAHSATRPNLLSVPLSLPSSLGTDGVNGINGINGTNGSHRPQQPTWQNHALDARYHSRTFAMPRRDFSAIDVVSALSPGGKPDQEHDHIILDSANAHLPAPAPSAIDVRGRYSIIAIDVPGCLRFEHVAGTGEVMVRLPRTSIDTSERRDRVRLEDGEQGIWRLLANLHERRRITLEGHGGEDSPPFLGGFMGYVTYEQGLHDIRVGIDPAERDHNRPDICLAWVTKSVVLDHVKGVAHVQCLSSAQEEAETWINETVEQLSRSKLSTNVSEISRKPESLIHVDVQKPDSSDYEDKVRLCQEFIAAGESYELCLTDQTNIKLSSGHRGNDKNLNGTATGTTLPLPNGHSHPATNSHQKTNGHAHTNGNTTTKNGTTSDLPSPWTLYIRLRTTQPAPFASYIRLGGATLLSSSPERFLRCEGPSGLLCKMKPMKGTVRKATSTASSKLNTTSEGVRTLAEAEALLRVPKEEAENLMIVDLVRHDLHSVCGPGGVTVPQLLDVEEYASVFQMVTVVEGRLPAPSPSLKNRYTGLDVLAASLPPGSMTGAPKKRSCEILRGLERRERSLYSGVVGYMCVSGRADWSVTIRSAWRWDGEEEGTWHLGAGGAVTILSTAEGEREEMFAKLQGPLRGLFGGFGEV